MAGGCCAQPRPSRRFSWCPRIAAILGRRERPPHPQDPVRSMTRVPHRRSRRPRARPSRRAHLRPRAPQRRPARRRRPRPHLHGNALQRLDDTHHVTSHLGATQLERACTPTSEQDTTLWMFKAEPTAKSRVSWRHDSRTTAHTRVNPQAADDGTAPNRIAQVLAGARSQRGLT